MKVRIESRKKGKKKLNKRSQKSDEQCSHRLVVITVRTLHVREYRVVIRIVVLRGRALMRAALSSVRTQRVVVMQGVVMVCRTVGNRFKCLAFDLLGTNCTVDIVCYGVVLLIRYCL